MKALSIREAASKSGMSAQFLRIGLQQGIFPFGRAVKMSTRYTYYIMPDALDAYMKGEK